jgi:hypothetical protein
VATFPLKYTNKENKLYSALIESCHWFPSPNVIFHELLLVSIDMRLCPMRQEALTNKLLEIRVCQSHEQQAFIATLEARANSRGGPETPDDYVCGSGK